MSNLLLMGILVVLGAIATVVLCAMTIKGLKDEKVLNKQLNCLRDYEEGAAFSPSQQKNINKTIEERLESFKLEYLEKVSSGEVEMPVQLMSVMEQKNQAMLEELDFARDTMNKLQDENDKIKEQYNDLYDTALSYKQAYEDNEVALKAMQESGAAADVASSEEFKVLKETCNQALGALELAKAEAAQASDKAAKMELENIQLKDELRIAKELTGNNEFDIDAATKRIGEEYEKQYKEIVDDLNTKLKIERSKIKDLEAAVQAANESERDMRFQLSTMETEKKNLEEANIRLEVKGTRLEREKEEIAALYANAQEQIKQAEAKTKEAEAKLEEAIKTNGESIGIKSAQAASGPAGMAVSTEVEELQDKIKNTEFKYKQLQEEMHKKDMQISAMGDMLGGEMSTAEEIANLRNDLRQKENEIQSLRNSGAVVGGQVAGAQMGAGVAMAGGQVAGAQMGAGVAMAGGQMAAGMAMAGGQMVEGAGMAVAGGQMVEGAGVAMAGGQMVDGTGMAMAGGQMVDGAGVAMAGAGMGPASGIAGSGMGPAAFNREDFVEREEYERVRAKLKAADAELEEAQSELKFVKSRLEDKTRQVDKLKAHILDLEDTVDTLRSKLQKAEAKAMISGADDVNNLSNEELAAQIAKLEEYKAEVARLTNQVEALKEMLKERSDALKDLEDKAKEASQENAELKGQLTVMADPKNQQQIKIENYKEEWDAEKRKVAELEEQIKELESKLEDKDKEIAKLREQCNNYVNEISLLKNPGLNPVYVSSEEETKASSNKAASGSDRSAHANLVLTEETYNALKEKEAKGQKLSILEKAKIRKYEQALAPAVEEE